MRERNLDKIANGSLASLDVEDLDCLDDLLSFYVRSASYVLSTDLDSRLANLEVARGTGKITALLLIDSHPGIRASAIAEATLRDRPSTSRIITQLVRNKLIIKRETPGERRAFGLYITPSGHVLAEKVRGIVKTQSDEFFAFVPQDDRDALMRITRNIYRKIREERAK
ncbi:MarR family winged helix-turn-helix transcriptional regulator [Roseovarius arcticus]|uniref:MarR family winged helix-turn-helix transcriptional regulator n=1 Tax=Roseovarius arcticus TaxID=2547404 RepID=UPI001FE6B0ED|nr:MarR family winged helix-turn-helix transcriptional regulator [Roseovarius arcticus]